MSLISEHPKVIRARTRRENAERQLAQAEARLASLRERYAKERAVLVEAVQEDRVPSGYLRLETSSRRAELEVELAREGLDLARQAEAEAHDRAKELVRRKLTRDYRNAILELDAALATTAQTNARVLDIYYTLQEELGASGVSALHWPEFLPQSDRHQSRLRQWRKAAGLEQQPQEQPAHLEPEVAL